MFTGSTYLLIAIITLAVLAFFIFYNRNQKPGKNFTLLAGLAFGFILCGILFGENQTIGYSLLGIGVVLAIADIVTKTRSVKK